MISREELSIDGERWLVYPLELPVYLCESERHIQSERAEFKLACPETGGCRILCAACVERLRRSAAFIRQARHDFLTAKAAEWRAAGYGEDEITEGVRGIEAEWYGWEDRPA